MTLLRPSPVRLPHRACRAVGAVWLALAAGWLLPAPASAQDAETKAPEPVDVNILTKDGVRLRATYYGGTKGKETVPVVLLHEFKGNRHDMAGLAASLQKSHGHAALTVDLRGHGDSTEQADNPKKLEATSPTFTPHFQWMIKYDMEAVKTFLLEKNNAGEVNIDRLCLVGAEMGASVAMIWTTIDWSWPQLAPTKQGQDVKAVVMISPEPAFRTLRITDNAPLPQAVPDVLLERSGMQTIQQAQLVVRNRVSIYVAVGARDSAAVSEAQRVFSTFERFRRKPTKPEELDAIFDKTLDTKLQGAKLLQGLGLDANIARFIQMRCVDPSYPWQTR